MNHPAPLHDRGISELLLFAAASLLIVVAVVAVGAVGHWWILIPVMVVDLAVTFAVMFNINRLLNDDGDSPA